MRILHVVPTYLPAWRHGGPAIAVHGLARALAGRGHGVSVFTTDVHGRGALAVPVGEAVHRDGVEVRYFPVRTPRRLYFSPALGEALRRGVAGFDVVHVHSLFLWPTAAAARAAARAAVPYLVAPRGMLVADLFRRRGFWRKHLWLHLVARRALERAAGLHVTSELEAAEAARFGLRLPPVYCVPNGIDLGAAAAGPEAGAAAPAPPGEGYFLYLGRLTWKKGIDRLVAALPAVPRARLVLAGNDEEGLWPRLKVQAAAAGVAGRLDYRGPVDAAGRVALLRHATALLLASHSENFANVVLEAMESACPVVVTPEVGLAATVARAGAGLVVAGQPEDLAEAMNGLLDAPDRRREMGRRGAAAAQAFGWPIAAERMEEVYRQVVSSSPQTPRSGGGRRRR